MAGILELSDQECKTPMSNVLRAVMNKVDSMQEQILKKTKPRKGRRNKTEQSIQGLRTTTKSGMYALWEGEERKEQRTYLE